MLRSLIVLTLACLASCGTMNRSSSHTSSTPGYAIAIHGGAGTIPKDTPEPKRQEYLASLEAALRIGQDELARGGTALDACEKVVRFLEDDPKFNAGKGAVFTADGKHELDASIMDGRTHACGAVAGVRTIKNPISLARLVMEKSGHVFMAGEGAEQFAAANGVERVDPSYFDTPQRYDALQRALEERRKKESAEPKPRGTVGCVALDTHGNLAAATSTGGMTAKRFGRVGDTPVIGAGTYADNRTCAVSCTGTGEEFIRYSVARTIAALMEYKGYSADRAARTLIFETLKPDDGGVIVVSHTGEIAMPYSSEGMFRGAADSGGRFEVAIWK